jgi:hypothetical protein
MNLHNNQNDYYENKYIKYKRKYLILKQFGGELDELRKIFPREKNLYYIKKILPQIYELYIDLNYKNIILVDVNYFFSKEEYQLFNIFNLNQESFKNFYKYSIYKKTLSTSQKIEIILNFFDNNFISLETKPFIIICLRDTEVFKYEFKESTKYVMLIVILPNTNDFNLTDIFLSNQLLLYFKNLNLLPNKSEYNVYLLCKLSHPSTETSKFSFQINLFKNEKDTTFNVCKIIKKSNETNNNIELTYNNNKLNFSTKDVLYNFIINLIKDKSIDFNIEKYVKVKKVTDINIILDGKDYKLTGNITNTLNDNYLNNYIFYALHITKDIIPTENDIFFFNYNDTKDTIIEKYDNFKNFSLIMDRAKKMSISSANSNMYKNYIKSDKNIFSFLYKIKKDILYGNVDNMFYDFISSLCANEFKTFFPNFIHTFYYFVYAKDKETTNETIYNKIIKIISGEDSLEQLKQNLFLTCFLNNGHYEDDSSGIAMEEITNSLNTRNIVNKYLKENIIYNFKKKTSKLFDYVIWSLLIQIYTALNSLKNNFTHYDLHLENIIYKQVPNDKYVKINYYNGNFTPENFLFDTYTKYIPVIIDYGRSNFSCSKFNTTFIANILCEKHELNTCFNTYNKDCNLTNIGINYSETSKDLDNIKNKNVSQDLRYFALFMEYLITEMNDDSISKKNLYIYKDLKNYEFEGWMQKQTKLWFFKKVRPDINKYYVPEQKRSDVNQINNVESLYNYFIKFYKTRIRKIIPSYIKLFNDNLYGTINIDITRQNKWKFN